MSTARSSASPSGGSSSVARMIARSSIVRARRLTPSSSARSRKQRESEVWREGARLREYCAMTPELFGPTRRHKFLSLVDPELVEAPPWRS